MSNIQYHIKKYAETKTYNMGERDKKELQNYYGQVFPKEKKLNIRCSSCVARGLKRLANIPEPVKKVKKIESSPIELEDMKMPQLRELAKSLGVKVVVKKVDLISNIINNVKA